MKKIWLCLLCCVVAVFIITSPSCRADAIADLALEHDNGYIFRETIDGLTNSITSVRYPNAEKIIILQNRISVLAGNDPKKATAQANLNAAKTKQDNADAEWCDALSNQGNADSYWDQSFPAQTNLTIVECLANAVMANSLYPDIITEFSNIESEFIDVDTDLDNIEEYLDN